MTHWLVMGPQFEKCWSRPYYWRKCLFLTLDMIIQLKGILLTMQATPTALWKAHLCLCLKTTSIQGETVCLVVHRVPVVNPKKVMQIILRSFESEFIIKVTHGMHHLCFIDVEPKGCLGSNESEVKWHTTQVYFFMGEATAQTHVTSLEAWRKQSSQAAILASTKCSFQE